MIAPAPSSVPRLLSLHVSPWSERARWALDHHRIAYERAEPMQVLGEQRLRKVVGPDKPRATVPVLLVGDEVLTESWDIARFADRTGAGAPLLPAEHEPAIRTWVERADRAMESGRALVLAAMLRSPGALDEGGPPAMPALLRPLARPLARRAMRAFARKYGLSLEDTSAATRAMREGLDALRAGLGERPGLLLGAFSYADIAMATLLQGVRPVDDRFLRLRPATRAAWTQTELATEYADLLAWRDRVYETHRGSRVRETPPPRPPAPRAGSGGA